VTTSAPTVAAAAAKPRKSSAPGTKPRAQISTPSRKQTLSSPKTQKPSKAPRPRSIVRAVAPKVAPTLAHDAPAKAQQKARSKLVRDSFTMPQPDFDLIATLKDRALGFKRPTKKSELLRAGLQVLASLRPDELNGVLSRLVPLKTGRPKKVG